MNPSSATIRQIAAICQRAAHGDLEARISPRPEDPELAQLCAAINLLLDTADAYVRESAAAMEHCARGEYHRPILERGLLGAYRNSARTINEAVLKMRTDAEMISRLEAERTAVAARVAATTESVNGSAGQLRATAHSIGEHVASTRRLATEVKSSTDVAAQSVNAVAAACQELSICTSEIARRTEESTGLTRTAVTETTTAEQTVQDLGVAAHKITGVVDVINKIARQTNLLALNATIEAARAGEHGRSFAVVAEEVKNLSRETAQATQKISAQIEGMQSATGRVASVIGGIGESVRRIDAAAAAISRSVSEQASATEEIAQRIGEVSRVSQDISGKMNSVNAASAGLEEASAHLTTAAETLAAESATLSRETAQLGGAAQPQARAA